MTKKFLAVIGAFIISFTFSYTVKATISNGITGEPQVKIQTKSANANSGEITFEVETSSAGLYRMDLWQCPARKSDKTLQTYTFELNGKTLNATSTPEIAGWSVLSYPETIYLKNGKNTISVKIDMPYVPNVEFIELTKDSSRKKSRMQASNAYKDYISAIRSASLSTKSSSVIHAPSLPSGDSSLNPPVDANKDTTSLILSEPDFTPYGYNYHRIPWFGYTFYTTAYFTEGQTITCTSEGINGVQHIMEIFSADSPKDYSWTKPSTNGKINMAVTIPKAGKYYIKVRTFKNGTTGLCNLYINNLMSYEQVPICTMGVKSYFAKEVGNYTIFTANCVSDPILWSVKGQCYDGTIYAFNDDYASAGDFVWGRNSRINHKYFTVNDYSRILISSASSFNPTGSCDLYVGCKKSTAYLHFDKLKEDDAIASAPASTDYNCISWSGGITSYWEWPGNPASEYYIEGDELASFDLFYSSERYPGCTRYTRTGATAANSVVDLWGTQENGVKVLTHGSITRNSDGNHHGYDWESKPGAMTRTFHPRNALEGIDYGKVLYYYKPANNSTEEYISLEQSIADNKAIMEKVELTLGQEAYISEYIADLSSQAVLNFNNLYRNWENIWNNSIFSNPDAQKGSVAYQQLLSACRNNNNLKYIVYDKINKGITSAIPLFEDLVLTNNSTNIKRMRSIHLSNSNYPYSDGKKIVRSISSNLKILLKQIVPESQNTPSQNKAKHSTPLIADSFNVDVIGNTIKTQLTIGRQSNVNIDIIDINGNFIERIINKTDLESGSYQFDSEIQGKGVYFVRCMINEHLDVKKIIINN